MQTKNWKSRNNEEEIDLSSIEEFESKEDLISYLTCKYWDKASLILAEIEKHL